MASIRASILSGSIIALSLSLPQASAQQKSPPPPPPKPAPRPSPPKPVVSPRPQAARPAPSAAVAQQRRAPLPAVRGNVPPQPAQRQTFVSPPRVLNPAETSQQAALLRGERAKLPGLNHNALPPGRMTVNPDHTIGLAGDNGKNYLLRSGGSVLSYQNNGRHALLDPTGHVQALQTHDMTINRGALGERRIQALQPGGGAVVRYGPHHGYVERPIVDRGHRLLQRVVLSGGHSSTQVYRPFAYGTSNMAAYVPNVYYTPAFYGWLGNGWQSPVSYQWGWSSPAAPAAYDGYYAPQASYAAPEQWMTDYTLNSTLDEGYANQPPASGDASQAAGMVADMPILASSAPAPITPAIKNQVTAQLARDLAVQREEAALVSTDPAHGPPVRRDVPAALDPSIQVYLVGSMLQVVSGGQQCQLRPGDILFLPHPAANGATSAFLVVESSLKGDCPGDAQVNVSVRDLQEMSNHFRQNICSAEDTIASNKTQGHLPPAPEAKPLYTMQDARTKSEMDAQTEQAVDELQIRATLEEKSVEQEMSASGGSN